MLFQYFIQQLFNTQTKIAMGTGIIIWDVPLPHASTKLLINIINFLFHNNFSMKKELGKLSELDLDIIYLKANASPSPSPEQFMVVNEIRLISNIIRSNSMT